MTGEHQEPVRISEAAAAAIAVRPIPREAAESGARAAAELAIRLDQEHRLSAVSDEEAPNGQ